MDNSVKHIAKETAQEQILDKLNYFPVKEKIAYPKFIPTWIRNANKHFILNTIKDIKKNYPDFIIYCDSIHKILIELKEEIAILLDSLSSIEDATNRYYTLNIHRIYNGLLVEAYNNGLSTKELYYYIQELKDKFEQIKKGDITLPPDDKLFVLTKALFNQKMK